MVMDLPSRYAASRRGRGPINQASASCLVDGCNSDLSKCRDYHRRHKVCEIHSKTPKVTIRGQEQRFCQQCSRFHSLVEFDDVKRSCRKRLDGHNRRRRKPQLPESSILVHSTAQFLSDFHGAAKFVVPTGTGPPQVFPTASCSFSTDYFFSRSHFGLGNKKAPSSSSSMPLSVSQSLSWDQVQFPFLQGNTHQEPLPNSSTAQGMRMNGGGCSQEMFLRTASSESSSYGRALSLLSSLPPHTEASPLPTQHQTMLVSDQREEDMFFQIRHDGSSLHHHHTPSAWEE